VVIFGISASNTSWTRSVWYSRWGQRQGFRGSGERLQLGNVAFSGLDIESACRTGKQLMVHVELQAGSLIKFEWWKS
jgi:hypothetical protein